MASTPLEQNMASLSECAQILPDWCGRLDAGGVAENSQGCACPRIERARMIKHTWRQSSERAHPERVPERARIEPGAQAEIGAKPQSGTPPGVRSFRACIPGVLAMLAPSTCAHAHPWLFAMTPPASPGEASVELNVAAPTRSSARRDGVERSFSLWEKGCWQCLHPRPARMRTPGHSP